MVEDKDVCFVVKTRFGTSEVDVNKMEAGMMDRMGIKPENFEEMVELGLIELTKSKPGSTTSQLYFRTFSPSICFKVGLDQAWCKWVKDGGLNPKAEAKPAKK